MHLCSVRNRRTINDDRLFGHHELRPSLGRVSGETRWHVWKRRLTPSRACDRSCVRAAGSVCAIVRAGRAPYCAAHPGPRLPSNSSRSRFGSRPIEFNEDPAQPICRKTDRRVFSWAATRLKTAVWQLQPKVAQMVKHVLYEFIWIRRTCNYI